MSRDAHLHMWISMSCRLVRSAAGISRQIPLSQRDLPRPRWTAAHPPRQHVSLRPFSSSSPWGVHMLPPRTSMKQSSMPSLEILLAKQRKEVAKAGVFPEDAGLAPQTFIMPEGKDRPSWRHFGRRWKLEKHRWTIRGKDLAMTLAYRWWIMRPRPRLRLHTISAAAASLHRDMYQHFARGDLSPVDKQLCDGIRNVLRTRLAQRPPHVAVRWELQQHLRSPRLMSFKVAKFPSMDGDNVKGDPENQNGFVQAVVRIHSRQRLWHVRSVSGGREGKKQTPREVRVDSRGRALVSPADIEQDDARGIKETIEYFVIQKNVRKSQEGPWKVWGTTQPSRLDEN